MAVMNVRIVRMTMRHRRVPVGMQVRFTRVPCEVMLVKMMLIVLMCMLVLVRMVRMTVAMALVQMQPHSGSHQQCGQPEAARSVLAENQNRDRGAGEGCGREISPRACSTKPAQRQHE